MPEIIRSGGDGSVVLSLYVQPAASRTGIAGCHGDALKVRVAAPAEGGQANRAVVRLLADSLGLRITDIELVSGATSRSKRARLHGVDVRRAARWLEHNMAEEAVRRSSGPRETSAEPRHEPDRRR
jgi:uncharacterized protein (TIGR00251 family)